MSKKTDDRDIFEKAMDDNDLSLPAGVAETVIAGLLARAGGKYLARNAIGALKNPASARKFVNRVTAYGVTAGALHSPLTMAAIRNQQTKRRRK